MENRINYMKEYNAKYKQSLKGHVKYIYSHQVRNCKQRNHPMPEYTEQELYQWYVSNPTHLSLHETWVQSNCDKELTPSVDRLDNSKTYSIKNIELVTWKENKQRAYKAIRENTLPNSGLLNDGHSPIVQYTLTGQKVKEYISINECSRETGINHRGISEVCRKLRNTYKGYFWAYLKDEAALTAKFTTSFLTTAQKSYKSSIGFLVKIITTNNEEKILTVKEASSLLGISAHKVRQLAKNIPSNRTFLPESVSKIELIIKDKY